MNIIYKEKEYSFIFNSSLTKKSENKILKLLNKNNQYKEILTKCSDYYSSNISIFINYIDNIDISFIVCDYSNKIFYLEGRAEKGRKLDIIEINSI